MNKETQYWFPAKRYGWGWGFPITWQGWVVFLSFFALQALGLVLFPPAANAVPFLIYTAVLSVVLVAICYLKGEPPAWRWGKR